MSVTNIVVENQEERASKSGVGEGVYESGLLQEAASGGQEQKHEDQDIQLSQAYGNQPQGEPVKHLPMFLPSILSTSTPCSVQI